MILDISALTPRQLEVIEIVAQGKSEKQTAKILSISPNTVHAHMAKACRKTGIDNRICLIVAFAKWQERQEILALLNPSR